MNAICGIVHKEKIIHFISEVIKTKLNNYYSKSKHRVGKPKKLSMLLKSIYMVLFFLFIFLLNKLRTPGPCELPNHIK